MALCCGDAALADDIAQEAFMKAYVALDSLADESAFKAWLYRIAINCVNTHRRSPRNSDNTLALDSIADRAGARHADDAFRYEELYAALDTLNADERSAIALYYIEGYTPEEIATISGMTVGAIYKQLSRGRSRLRQILK